MEDRIPVVYTIKQLQEVENKEEPKEEPCIIKEQFYLNGDSCMMEISAIRNDTRCRITIIYGHHELCDNIVRITRPMMAQLSKGNAQVRNFLRNGSHKDAYYRAGETGLYIMLNQFSRQGLAKCIKEYLETFSQRYSAAEKEPDLQNKRAVLEMILLQGRPHVTTDVDYSSRRKTPIKSLIEELSQIIKEAHESH
ncbi:hypothetical protein HY486_03950 [Candidatus Woesearchaeota archaeon]|nr:hypothetical protein [Candidatus Woesearchaeota archaeon]